MGANVDPRAEQLERTPATGPGPEWKIEHHDALDSTQAAGRQRPAWSAVIAAQQNAGRGQAERGFISNRGGLYLTAVLPYSGDALASRGFALAVGWALREMLRREIGVEQIRLRWPNDLMIGDRKLGGILVEQGGPDTLLVGVGLNVTNRPWAADSSLESHAGRLADAVPGGNPPELGALAADVLRAIRTAHEMFGQLHLAGFLPFLNASWGPPHQVEIDPADGVGLSRIRGWFQGIGQEGCVVLQAADGGMTPIPAHKIGRLRELS